MRAVSVEKRTNRKKAYQPDLDELLTQCELNYRLVKRLIPEIDGVDSARKEETEGVQRWQFKTDSLLIDLKVTDSARYTTTLTMFVETPNVKMIRYVNLIVRLYHDAKMLEVMEGTGPSALKAIYEHPNQGMKNADEKRQLNRYVGECFRACSPSTRVEVEAAQG